MAKHVHRRKASQMRAFAGCIAGVNCNPASHGGVTHSHTCRCGAVKQVNTTGPGRSETSGWQGGPQR